MKVLINVPSFSLQGGVANHYLGLRPYWSELVFYNIVGRRRFGPGLLYLPFDVIKFVVKVLSIKPDLIILNPSLAINAVKRDTIFLKIGLYLKQKVVVFFHGWNETLFSDTLKKKLACDLNNSNGVIVLAEDFRTALREWGFSGPIFLSTTKVDNKLISGFLPSSRVGGVKKLLFLSRIEIDKGIITAIDAFILLKRLYPDLTMDVVGTGGALDQTKGYIKKTRIKGITLTGALSGEKLRKEFLNADIYILPTSHGEGIPTSVLEAMAFGLPVITRPIGGLKDFFLEGKMGYIVESLSPEDFSDRVETLIKSPDKSKQISLFNYKYAQEHFMASQVANDLEAIFHHLLL